MNWKGDISQDSKSGQTEEKTGCRPDRNIDSITD